MGCLPQEFRGAGRPWKEGSPLLRPRRKLSRKRGFSSNAHLPSNPQWSSAPRWHVPPTGPWTVPGAPAPSRGTRAALSAARKASRSWGPRASGAPRPGTGTTRSPRAQVGSPGPRVGGSVGRWVSRSVGQLVGIHGSECFLHPCRVRPRQPCSLPGRSLCYSRDLRRPGPPCARLRELQPLPGRGARLRVLLHLRLRGGLPAAGARPRGVHGAGALGAARPAL